MSDFLSWNSGHRPSGVVLFRQGLLWAVCLALLFVALGQRNKRSSRAENAAFNQQSEAVLDDAVRTMETLPPIHSMDSKGIEQAKAQVQKMGEGVDQLNAQMKKIGATDSGLNGKIARAATRILAYSNAASDSLDAARDEARAVGLADLSKISTKADLEQRRKIVRNVLEKNLAQRQSDLNRENFIRQTVREEGLPPVEAEKFLKGFLERHQRALPISLRVRDADHQLMTTYLGIFDLLEREWGHWQTQPGGAISFEKPDAITAYNGYVAAASKAIADERQASKEKLAATLLAAKGLQHPKVLR